MEALMTGPNTVLLYDPDTLFEGFALPWWDEAFERAYRHAGRTGRRYRVKSEDSGKTWKYEEITAPR